MQKATLIKTHITLKRHQSCICQAAYLFISDYNWLEHKVHVIKLMLTECFVEEPRS